MKDGGIPNSFDQNLRIGTTFPKSIARHIGVTGDFAIFRLDINRHPSERASVVPGLCTTVTLRYRAMASRPMEMPGRFASSRKPRGCWNDRINSPDYS